MERFVRTAASSAWIRAMADCSDLGGGRVSLGGGTWGKTVMDEFGQRE